MEINWNTSNDAHAKFVWKTSDGRYQTLWVEGENVAIIRDAFDNTQVTIRVNPTESGKPNMRSVITDDDPRRMQAYLPADDLTAESIKEFMEKEEIPDDAEVSFHPAMDALRFSWKAL